MKVVFDDNHGVTTRDKLVKNGQKTFNVVGVEASGGLVENIKGFTSGASRQFGGKFNALSFTARKSGGWLTEANVA